MFTYADIAKALNISYNQVAKLVATGKLKGGNGIVHDTESLRRYCIEKGYEVGYATLLHQTQQQDQQAQPLFVKRVVMKCLNNDYLQYMPFYTEKFFGKKSQEQIKHIAQSAALIERFSDTRRLRLWCVAEGIEKIKLEQVYDVLLEVGFAPYGIHHLTKTNLRNWFAKHKDPKGLIHGLCGKANAAKFSANDDIVGWTLNLCINGMNHNMPHILRELEARCRLFGYPVPSLAWVKSLVKKWEPTIAEYLYDDRSPHKQKYRVYIPTMKAPYAGTVWTVDGTQYNIVPHTTDKGKQSRLYYVAVRDEFSGDILSVVPCYKESADVYLEAIKHAIQQTGYLPYEIRHDKFPGHNTEAWKLFADQLEREGVKLTITVSAFAKARHERMYSSLQSVFDSFNKLSYRDSPLSTRKHGRVTAKFIAKAEQWAKSVGFNYQMAVQELNAMVAFYRHAPYSAWSTKYRNVTKSPQELHDQCHKPHVKRLDVWQIAKLCWERNTYQPRHGYVQFSRNYQEYRYRLSPELFYEHHELSIAFNPEQPETVFAFDVQSDAFLAELPRQTDILTTSPDAEWQKLQDAKNWKTSMKHYANNKLSGAVAKANTHRESIDEQTGELTTQAIDEVAVLLGGIAPKERVSHAEDTLNMPTTASLSQTQNDDDDEPDNDFYKKFYTTF